MKIDLIRTLLVAGILSSSGGLAENASAQQQLRPGTWQSFNTCWLDFDVGGGKLCGVIANTSCVTPNTVQCFHADGVNPLPQGAVPEQPPFGPLPASALVKAISVDESGTPWVLSSDGRIYYGISGVWHFWHSVYLTVDGGCADQIAVQGGTVMLRGCDHSVHKYVQSINDWPSQVTAIKELSVGANPYTQDGSGAFWAYADNSYDWIAPTSTLTFSPVNTKGNTAAVNVPIDCYWSTPTTYTCQAAPNLVPAVHQGGGELSFIGQFPAGNIEDCTPSPGTTCPPPTPGGGAYSNPAPVCYTTHGQPLSNSGFSQWYSTPWFASFAYNVQDFASFNLVGLRQVDRYFDQPSTGRILWQTGIYSAQSLGGECDDLTPGSVWLENITLDGPPIQKIREGTKFGHLGGMHSPGVTDARWILTGTSEIWSYEY
jgi:hypothetical protein